MAKVNMEPSWLAKLQPEFEKPYMTQLRDFLRSQYAAGRKIFPSKVNYFATFNLTPFEKVKVVILGQDPYHGAGQAHGLCFSVLPGITPPPSLVNIFKELKSDLHISPPKNGCLTSWAEQGVLLLNSVLTVEEGRAAAHQGKGWETFTDQVIRELNDHRENLVFILWGSYAQKKAAFVDRKKHFVIESPHPSPLSSHRGFFGSHPFSKANQYLQKHGIKSIDWNLSTSATSTLAEKALD